MNEKLKFTPGPWLAVKYTKKKFGLGNPGDSAWMMLTPVYTDALDSEMAANACLIAAAPELLEALQELMAWQVKNVKAWSNPAYDYADSIIAKATGKTSEAA